MASGRLRYESKPVGITLELTLEEARFLRHVTHKKIGGGGPVRNLNDSIWKALDDPAIGDTIPGVLDGSLSARSY